MAKGKRSTSATSAIPGAIIQTMRVVKETPNKVVFIPAEGDPKAADIDKIYIHKRNPLSQAKVVKMTVTEA